MNTDFEHSPNNHPALPCPALTHWSILSLLILLPVAADCDTRAKPKTAPMEGVIELEEVKVLDKKPNPDRNLHKLNAKKINAEKLATDKRSSSDTASLFKDDPSVTLNAGGGVSSLPSVHGLADDRVKITVNGMSVTSACSNHMNPTLSYAAPNNVGQALVMAGVTPVSMGGDSIGGTIAVDPLAPKFASQQKTEFSGNAGGYFRSVNDNIGNHLDSHYATDQLSFDYNGSWSKAGNYQTGNDGPSVEPSRFLSTNHYFRGALKLDQGFIAADVSGQHIPYQGFPNQRMDVVGNDAVLGGLSFEQKYDWGKLDARIYHHQTWHTMDTMSERRTAPMLMKAEGYDFGYRVRAHIPFADVHVLRVGNEFLRQDLKDWWPSANKYQKMDFMSVNDGQRNRVGTFVEWQADWTPQWTTQLGLRNDMVFMDTGAVHGYYPDKQDLTARLFATAFNASDRARTDTNFDVTAQARYTPNETSLYQVGFARKVRSPNLYERYAWYGHNSMVTWFGDGNAYQGNPDLKPETAYNFSLTGTWNDPRAEIWSLSVSPFYNHITDYIWGQTESIDNSGFRGMQFVNLPYADLFGVDATGRYTFVPSSPAGKFSVRGKLAYTRGIAENGLTGRPCPYAKLGLTGICNAQGWSLDGLKAPEKVDLYHIMPVNGTITFEHHIDTDWGKFDSEIGIDLVDSKTRVAQTYGEPKTPGYVLLNVRSSYQYKKFKLDFGVDNLLDKQYYHPLGGINIAATYAQGFPPPGLIPVAAMGRSVFVSVNLEY